MEKFIENVKDNVVFFTEFLAVVAALFLVAYLAEKYAQKKAGVKEKIFTTRKIAMIGMFSAIASVLMLFEFPMPFADSIENASGGYAENEKNHRLDVVFECDHFLEENEKAVHLISPRPIEIWLIWCERSSIPKPTVKSG